MPHPFRFSVVIADAPSRTAFVTLARRAEELGYATLLMPDRTITGLAVLPALAVAAEVTTLLRVGSYVFCNDFRQPALLAPIEHSPASSPRSPRQVQKFRSRMSSDANTST